MKRLASPRTGGIIALVAILVLLPFLLPNKFFFDIVIKAGFAAILCVGLNLLIGYAGQISLGHAGFFGLGAYVSAILTTNHGWPALGAMLTGAFGVGVLAFLVGRPILKLKGHYLAMATLGMGIIISIVLNQELSLTGGPDGMGVAPFTVLGWRVSALSTEGVALFGTPLPALALSSDDVWYTLIAALLVVTVWLSLNLVQSPVGRALRAVHGSEVAAEVAGVDTARYKVLVFVISAVFAAIAGSLFAHYEGFVTPQEANFFSSIAYVTMVVLGGRASIFGAVLGALLLTLLPQLVAGFEDYEMMVFGLILMLTMIFMPRGLVPSIVTAAAKVRR